MSAYLVKNHFKERPKTNPEQSNHRAGRYQLLDLFVPPLQRWQQYPRLPDPLELHPAQPRLHQHYHLQVRLQEMVSNALP